MIDEPMPEKKEGRSTSLTFRVQDGILIKIDHFIKKNEFSGYPDFFRSAARYYLDYLEAREKGNHVERIKDLDKKNE